MAKKSLAEILKQARPTGQKVYADALLNLDGRTIGSMLRNAQTIEVCFTSEVAMNLQMNQIFVDHDETNVFEQVPGDLVSAFARATHKKTLQYANK